MDGKMSTTPVAALVIDAMVAIYVHDPGVSRTDVPSGGRIAGIARAALTSHDPSLRASERCYVRAVSPKDSRPLSDQVRQALTDAPVLMDGVLQQLGVDANDYQHEVWTEQVSPGASVVWIAARRSN